MQIANILTDLEYGTNKPAVKVLIDNLSTKEIRILFREGQEMKQHKTNFPIVVEIVQGSINFGVNAERYDLEVGTIVSLEGNIPHDLIANKDSIVRLTLHKLDDTKRVQAVADNSTV